MRYRAEFVEYDRDYHTVVGRNRVSKSFNTVEDALSYQYKHSVVGFDYMIEDVYDNKTGKKINIWEHTKAKSPNVEV